VALAAAELAGFLGGVEVDQIEVGSRGLLALRPQRRGAGVGRFQPGEAFALRDVPDRVPSRPTVAVSSERSSPHAAAETPTAGHVRVGAGRREEAEQGGLSCASGAERLGDAETRATFSRPLGDQTASSCRRREGDALAGAGQRPVDGEFAAVGRPPRLHDVAGRDEVRPVGAERDVADGAGARLTLPSDLPVCRSQMDTSP